MADQPKCEMCDDQGPLLLRARCHLTAPLSAELDDDTLVLRCYVPDCAKEVARFKIVRITWESNVDFSP